MDKSRIPPPNRHSSTNQSDATAVLGLMAKYWDPGKVKTRLGVKIGMEKSARLHKLFVTQLTKILGTLPNCPATKGTTPPTECQHILVAAPAERLTQFKEITSLGWSVEPQCDGDLGQRMQHWFQQRLASFRHAVLIGADCPTLDSAVIDQANALLESNDLVLGPCVDGGYYLIGIRGPWTNAHDGLFVDVPWSTDTVFPTTCQRATAAGLQLATLTVREDIDTIDELQRLRESLELSRAGNPQHAELADAIEAILGSEPSVGPAP